MVKIVKKKTTKKKTSGMAKMVKKVMSKVLPGQTETDWKFIWSKSFRSNVFRTAVYIENSGTVPVYINATLASVAGSPVPSYGALQFNIGSLDQLTTYQALFDQYRIVGIECEFMPQFNSDSTTGANTYLGEFYTVVDYDDVNTPTSLPYLREYETCKITNTMTKHVRRFRPHVAVAAYSGTFTSYANEISPWIDCASSAVQHYGIKYAFSGGGSTTLGAVYTLRTKLMIEFKNIH